MGSYGFSGMTTLDCEIQKKELDASGKSSVLVTYIGGLKCLPLITPGRNSIFSDEYMAGTRQELQTVIEVENDVEIKPSSVLKIGSETYNIKGIGKSVLDDLTYFTLLLDKVS